MKSPKSRARSFLLGLGPADVIGFHGVPVFSDDTVERLAEVIADAQEEVRQGFLRKPTKREPTLHGGQGRPR